MMGINDCVERFVENVTPTTNHIEIASSRMKNIRQLLENKYEIMEIFPTGSLLRGTGIRNVSDLDIFVVLHYQENVEGKTPRQIILEMKENLSSYNSKIVKRNGQAVTMYFGTWPNVDVVPSYAVSEINGGSHYEIPDINSNVWINTNPKVHDGCINKMSVNDKKRIILIKAWNQVHSVLIQSYHIETIALLCPPTSNDWASNIYQYFVHALSTIDKPLYHPLFKQSRVDGYLCQEEKEEVKKRIYRACRLSYIALENKQIHNERMSIGRYNVLFGQRFST